MPKKKLSSINKERSARAEKALSFYEDAAEENVTDLLTDLRHYCEQEGIHFTTVVVMSDIHHEEERRGK
jgi:hypothetical protein